jgi:hypothetical protein
MSIDASASFEQSGYNYKVGAAEQYVKLNSNNWVSFFVV